MRKPSASAKRRQQSRARLRRGFTLVELVIVIVIIGILAAFILTAAADGVRRAEERATQSLIIKLESAVMTRIEALQQTSVDPNLAHAFLASISTPSTVRLQDAQRAQVIARIDQFKYELPDVFYYAPSEPNFDADYPVNFAGVGFPGTPMTAFKCAPFVLPLGNSIANNAAYSSAYIDTTGATTFGAAPLGGVVGPGVGVYGASYSAAGGIYKQLGYFPQGYDGRDNNGDGRIDEMAEGLDPTNQVNVPQVVLANLNNHKHNTARSEMLYALLVEGLGPLGSVLDKDDFTQREVQDTDGDGLLEFVDAWGQPLQFYRWPVYYISDVQKYGYQPYGQSFQQSLIPPRELCPLDPNQTLMSPAWWGDYLNNPNQPSASAAAFMTFFHSLVDPQTNSTPTVGMWDRGAYYTRRAYFSKFLIVSSGPDQQLGIAQFDVDYSALVSGGSPPFPGPNGIKGYSGSGPGEPPPPLAQYFNLIENQGGVCDPNRGGTYKQTPNTSNPTTRFLQDAAGDDITNQNVLQGGGGLQ